jgi:AhpD family alkylhydroperoxidase
VLTVDRAEEVVKRAEEKRGYSPFWLRFMAEVDLEFLEAYSALYETVGARNVHLPPKFKELVVVAVLAVQREDYGLPFHIRRALSLGATKEEIVEVLQAAHFHTGALTLVHGLKALMEVLENQKKEKEAAGGGSGAQGR